MNKMSFNQYQKIAMSTLFHPFVSKGKQLEYATLALCGESGELANTVKKIIYYKDTSQTGATVVEELSDILWYVACVADALNVKLSEIATFSINKVTAKQKERDG